MSVSARPLPWSQLVGVSCLDGVDLATATRIGADFAMLAPRCDVGHQCEPLHGRLPHFKALAEQASLPVYALDRTAELQLTEAFEHGAQGVAGIPCGWLD